MGVGAGDSTGATNGSFNRGWRRQPPSPGFWCERFLIAAQPSARTPKRGLSRAEVAEIELNKEDSLNFSLSGLARASLDSLAEHHLH